jgi:alpha-aminoadipate carrier protein LysW
LPEVNKVPTAKCPECGEDVHVDVETDKGDIVECDECGIELEVVGLDPIELDVAEEDYYDEDDDFYDDDDY